MLAEQKANILIVDDVAANLMILSDMVRQAGHLPRPVISVAEAMKAVEAKIPDLILLDITMPEISGFEYCRMLKKNPKTQDIPIIFISAKDRVEDKQEAFQLGAADFITRPFEAQEVVMRIKTQLAGYQMRKEMEAYNKQMRMLAQEQLLKLKANQQNQLQTLIEAYELGSREPQGHAERVASVCRRLALALQLSPKYERLITEEFVECIGLAAALHDIGNLALDDSVLRKQGMLTEEERQIMQQHTVRGAETLKNMNFGADESEYLRMAEEIARYHHERYDGSGYPEGKKGDEIPIPARIVAIADVYTALRQEYSYRPAYSVEESIQIMSELSGSWFDPDIMKVFLRVQKK